MTPTESIARFYVIFRRSVTGSRPTAKKFDASDRSPLAMKKDVLFSRITGRQEQVRVA